MWVDFQNQMQVWTRETSFHQLQNKGNVYLIFINTFYQWMDMMDGWVVVGPGQYNKDKLKLAGF